MASKKIKDLAVKTGSYMKDGEEKGRYQNIGGMFKTDDGGVYLRLNRTFNPAGVPGEPDADSIIVGVYDLRDGDTPQKPAAAPAARQAPKQQESPAAFADDDIPF
ncbi:MAG: hypothetical protein ACTS6J_24735 [Burkholderiales bacterium]